LVFAVLGTAADCVLVSAARPVLRWQDTHRLRL
jgi:hypothetical protein